MLPALSVAQATCFGIGVNTCRTKPRRFRLASVLHPGAAGRTYAAYGGVYVSVALVWLWLIDGQKPDRWDVVGVAITLIEKSIIAFAPRLK
jgi:drug/metabolite transporter superfamily protein YnfA